MISLISRLFRRKEFSSTDYHKNDPIFNSKECYACTQMGVPLFHSTRYHPSQPPQWEASAGSSFVPHSTTPAFPNPTRCRNPLGRVIDPRGKNVKRWKRIVILARGMSLAVDPLFFYVISLSGSGSPCFYMDAKLAVIVTVVRTFLDVLHLGHLWLQFKLAFVSSQSMVVGCGKLVWDARAIISHNLTSLRGFWLDAFVILPIPQVVIWFVVPKLLREERIKEMLITLLVSYFMQFLPKVYHSVYFMKRLQKVTGYVFGNIWWRFTLNVIAYLIASHVTGACWYLLATQRFVSCLEQKCDRSRKCNLSLYCSLESRHKYLLPAAGNLTTVTSNCLDADGPFEYGIYAPVVLVYSSNSMADKILYPILWGLLCLNSFGNVLEPTSNLVEVIFSICITISGLALFVTLVGNIQVFLRVVMANKKQMQIKHRDMEWWMKRRQIPSHLRERVRHYQRQSWASLAGQDEMQLIQDLPYGIRRDIKRHLCLDLVKKVPLFHMLDDLILDNICDLVRPLIYCKGEKIIREGDPVQRIMFIVHGRVKRSQGLSRGFVATSVVDPGGFFGDELISWCLRLPFMDRLPASSATFTCTRSVEAFGIDADNLRYIIQHFRYKFASDSLKRTARYYSSNWRTWGAVVIQLAWRKYKMRTTNSDVVLIVGGSESSRLKHCAALFLSFKPHDHLE